MCSGAVAGRSPGVVLHASRAFLSPDAAHHLSRPFIDIMHIRLRVATQALNAGYNVLLSDADAVFLSRCVECENFHPERKRSVVSLPFQRGKTVPYRTSLSAISLLFFAGFAIGARGNFPDERGRRGQLQAHQRASGWLEQQREGGGGGLGRLRGCS